jgi:alkaline phosphatase D
LFVRESHDERASGLTAAPMGLFSRVADGFTRKFWPRPNGPRQNARMTRFLSAALGLLFLSLAAMAKEPDRAGAVRARLALVSDTHVTRGTNEDQASHKARLEKVIADVNAAPVDMVLIAGDLTQDGKATEIADFQKQIKGFLAPVWYVPGNHDVGNKLIGSQVKRDSVTAWRVRFFERSLGPSFFARERKGLRVIGINSPILGSGLPRERDMWCFLEKELSKSNAPATVLFSHYPPFVKTAAEKGGDYWNIEPEPRQRLLGLLKRASVKTVLTGHLHRELTNRYDGILFVTTPPVSFGLPKEKQPEGWTLVTIPAEGEARIEFRHIKR